MLKKVIEIYRTMRARWRATDGMSTEQLRGVVRAEKRSLAGRCACDECECRMPGAPQRSRVCFLCRTDHHTGERDEQ